MSKDTLTILIDFDGTCVRHEFPDIGKEIGAVPVLQKLVAKGHKLILYTMRSNLMQESNSHNANLINRINDAEHWFRINDIKLYATNVNPTQKYWTSSPKCHGDLVIDDRDLGIPLKTDEEGYTYVDWVKVQKLLEERDIL